MEAVPFNIEDWLPENRASSNTTIIVKPSKEASDVEQDIERVTLKIERSHTDLTAGYDVWLKIGFALAHELGEMGRSYFHRISRFYPKYSVTDTDKKYDNCLKSHREGVTINTFFYLAKQAGIEIAEEKKTPLTNVEPSPDADSEELQFEEDKNFNTPLLPVKIYQNLPKILSDICVLFPKGIEQDILFLSALTICSGILPNVEGVYFNRKLSPHLYLFITGPAAAGKGTMVWSRMLGQTIHEEMVREYVVAHEVYLKEMEEYENLPKSKKVGMPKPEEPNRTMLFIPANSSSAALTQLLAENRFRGIIFESEADTLSNTAKQDWGDSSDIFRKAFHHENTSVARKTNREMTEITDPHLTICLSGTPNQVHNLMTDVENGLFSRFMYYAFHDSRGFLNPFVSYHTVDYDAFFISKSVELYHFHEKLKNLSRAINFKLTEAQGERFTHFFQNMLDKNKMLLSRDLDANTKRLGVITFRIAMILSALRLMELEIGQKIKPTLVCTDQDFETAIVLASTLESHAVAVYQKMPKVAIKGTRLNFFEKLPETFDRKMYLAIAKGLEIPEKRADKYIAFFKTQLLKNNYNKYTKVTA